MRFKEWFSINEMSVSAGGPYELYHATSTGAGDSVLQSFREKGATGVGRGHGQGGGFFVHTNRDDAVKHALERKSGDISAHGADTEGAPMLVTVEVPDLDFREWDLDLEAHADDVMGYAAKRFKTLQRQDAAKKMGVSPASASYLGKDNDGEVGSPDFDKLSYNKYSIKVPTDTGGTIAVGHPLSPLYEPTGDNIFAAKLMAPYVYAHQDAKGDRHHKFEAMFFKSNYGKRNMNIKYVGSKPLKVKSIMVHDGKDWRRV